MLRRLLKFCESAQYGQLEFRPPQVDEFHQRSRCGKFFSHPIANKVTAARRDPGWSLLHGKKVNVIVRISGVGIVEQSPCEFGQMRLGQLRKSIWSYQRLIGCRAGIHSPADVCCKALLPHESPRGSIVANPGCDLIMILMKQLVLEDDLEIPCGPMNSGQF